MGRVRGEVEWERQPPTHALSAGISEGEGEGVSPPPLPYPPPSLPSSANSLPESVIRLN